MGVNGIKNEPYIQTNIENISTVHILVANGQDFKILISFAYSLFSSLLFFFYGFLPIVRIDTYRRGKVAEVQYRVDRCV